VGEKIQQIFVLLSPEIF